MRCVDFSAYTLEAEKSSAQEKHTKKPKQAYKIKGTTGTRSWNRRVSYWERWRI